MRRQIVSREEAEAMITLEDYADLICLELLEQGFSPGEVSTITHRPEWEIETLLHECSEDAAANGEEWPPAQQARVVN